MRMPFLRRFPLHIHRHAILKIPIEFQTHIKALVLILMHIDRFHQQPQVSVADVLFLDHLLQEVCCSFQLIAFPFADFIELLALLDLLLYTNSDKLFRYAPISKIKGIRVLPYYAWGGKPHAMLALVGGLYQIPHLWQNPILFYLRFLCVHTLQVRGLFRPQLILWCNYSI